MSRNGSNHIKGNDHSRKLLTDSFWLKVTLDPSLLCFDSGRHLLFDSELLQFLGGGYALGIPAHQRVIVSLCLLHVFGV